MEIFKIRASSAGKISGIKGLGETGKTYCKQWLKEKLYKRRTEIKSKYISILAGPVGMLILLSSIVNSPDLLSFVIAFFLSEEIMLLLLQLLLFT
jgi:hypothetical protein